MNELQYFELGIAVGAVVMTLIFYILSLETKRGDENLAKYIGRKIRGAVWWIVFTPLGLFRVRFKRYDKNHKWAVKCLIYNNSYCYYPNFLSAWRSGRADAYARYDEMLPKRKTEDDEEDDYMYDD